MKEADIEGLLQPGDCLLYRGSGVFSWIIRFKTWHPESHIEIYVGKGQSVASRDGKGVGKYPLRTKDIAYILRPKKSMNLMAGMLWFKTQEGQPYGWLDLLQFGGFEVDAKGMICSTFGTLFYRACSFDPFNGEDAKKIAPFQFKLCPDFSMVRDFVFTKS